MRCWRASCNVRPPRARSRNSCHCRPAGPSRGLPARYFGDVGAAADEAVTRGLLRYHDAALAFRHELGRLAVAGTLARSRAEDLHRRILAALIEQHADLSQLVHHASYAQDVKALLKYAPRAAKQAALAGSHREAAAHLLTALRHADSLGAAERARLLQLHATERDLTNETSIDAAT